MHHDDRHGRDAKLIPASPSPRFHRVFTWYTRRLMRRHFHAVRCVSHSTEQLQSCDAHAGPLFVLMNHASWWDPLVGVLLADEFIPSRSSLAPMDRDQLQRFKFMRKLGVFGIDPDDPASAELMHSYLAKLFAQQSRPTLWITPQGSFADVRQPLRLRPGAAVLASRFSGCRVVCVAVEYVFWQDQLPEIFLRCEACSVERPSTATWYRAMTQTMQHNAHQLAELVVKRDESAFKCITGGQSARVNPLYDAWLRLRGRSGRISAHRGPLRTSSTHSLPQSTQ